MLSIHAFLNVCFIQLQMSFLAQGWKQWWWMCRLVYCVRWCFIRYSSAHVFKPFFSPSHLIVEVLRQQCIFCVFIFVQIALWQCSWYLFACTFVSVHMVAVWGFCSFCVGVFLFTCNFQSFGLSTLTHTFWLVRFQSFPLSRVCNPHQQRKQRDVYTIMCHAVKLVP